MQRQLSQHMHTCTNPRVRHGDNVVHAASKLADTVISLVGNRKNDANLNDLRTLTQTVQSLAERNKERAVTIAPIPVINDPVQQQRAQQKVMQAAEPRVQRVAPSG